MLAHEKEDTAPVMLKAALEALQSLGSNTAAEYAGCIKWLLAKKQDR